MPTLERIACECCQKPLTGGADTFGGIGQTLCFVCFHEQPDPITKSVLLGRRLFLENLKERLNAQYSEAEEDYREARSRMGRLEDRISMIQAELDGRGMCDEGDDE